MNLTSHARQRAEQRGLSLPLSLRLDPSLSYAVRLGRVTSNVDGQPADHYARTESNGEWQWAIVRQGRVVTSMRRRGDQPSTPAALRVDRVVLLGT